MRKLYLITSRILVILICLTVQVAWAQDRVITGRVNAADDGSSLPGVTVLEKGTQNGTVTDSEGNFKLQVQPNAVLTISFVGYATQELPTGTQTNFSVKLKTDVATLQEVVVIGYGTVKKSDATGSVSVVDSKVFNKGVVNSPQELLQGKIAGVNITSNSGAPGTQSTIRIRGGSSLNASNDPLIVIDGVPTLNDNLGGSTNILATINPNDIESFTVLKDASATAIYGLRASNGVIIITTKRGGQGMHVSYSATITNYTGPKRVKVYNGDEFRTLINQQYAGQPAVLGLLGTANTDWQKEIYKKNAIGQDHAVTVSGTALKTPYRVSFGYNDTDGILRNYGFKRATLAVSLDPHLLNDKLVMSVNVKAMDNRNNFSEQGAIGNAIAYDPTKPVHSGDARWLNYTTWTTTPANGIPVPINLAPANPRAMVDLTDNTSKVQRSIGNVKFDYELPFTPDLHAVLNLGYDYTRTTGHNNLPDSTQWVYLPVTSGGRLDPYSSSAKNQLLDFYVRYGKTISPNSKFDVTGGYSWSHFKSQGGDSTRQISGEGDAILINKFITEFYLVSFFGRANYSFKDRYLVTASVREDATSRFNSKLRWGLFPSVALGWKLKQENFLVGVDAVSDLKLRVGYGVTGQQDLVNNNYPYIPTYTISGQTARYPFGTSFYNTLRPDKYNAVIKWETTATINAGIDFGFFKNRLTGTLDVYQKKSTDLINDLPPAQGTNFGTPLTSNVGSLTNKGVEVNLNYALVDNDDFNWTVGYNITFNQNRLTKLNLNNDPNYYVEAGFIGNTTGGAIQAQKVGHPRNSYYVYQQIYGSDGKPIEDAYVDRNKDGIINTQDLYFYKKPDASVYMGINSRLTYKNIDFAFTGRVSLGNYVYNNVASNATYNALYNSMGYLLNMSKQADNTQFKIGGNQRFSDYYIQNASFFRMDNINAGYTFRNLIGNKGSIRLGVGVQNAFVITRYRGIDPEISGGLDNNFFPRTRSFFFNLNATF